MLSDLLSESSSVPCSEEPLTPLNFDDLLDIAREFEFTRTITHIWPCEEDHNTCPETRLDDILATIVSAPNAEECPILPSGPTTPMAANVQEIDLSRLASMCPASHANACVSTDPALLVKSDNQFRVETGVPLTSTLHGWTPPNGSQFLDLDDGLILPQPVREMRNSPWPSMFCATSMEPIGDIIQSSAPVPAIGGMRSQTMSKPPLVNTFNTTASDDNPRKSVPAGVQPLTRTIDLVLARSTTQTNLSRSSQTAITPYTKAPHLPSVSTKHARAPRGGIPPHIARSVTKANILRVEQERKVMQDAFSNTSTREARKPSVLRRAAKVEREVSRAANGGSSGKNSSDQGENGAGEGRAAKRARV